MALTNQHVLTRISEQFVGSVLAAEEPYELLTVEIKKEFVLPILQFLKADSEIQVQYLTDICAVHYPEQSGREFAVVYHLHSLTNNFRLRLKAFLPSTNLKIASATAVFLGANWMERETYDFFGIQFEGHPDLRRILNVDDMDYFPMRKEYPLEDGTRTDKDDRFFGREGHVGVTFDE